MRSAPLAALDYGEPRGERELREALADQLGRTRGVVAAAEQIVIVSGAAQGVDLLARVLAARGARRVAVEDPSLDSQPERLRSNGLEPVAQPVDGDGLQVEGLEADAVIVTPAHQFPTGAVLSGARRRRLLEWSRKNDALVIEDDYDAEFRYDREPIRALQGLDRSRVAYLGTTSKTLAPALRLAWVVVPEHLADEAEEVKHLLDVCSPPIEQRALARLIRSGDYDRHVRRARTIYRRRRDALTTALREHLPELSVEGIAAGLHVLVRLEHGLDDEAVTARAERHGVRVVPLSRYTHSDGGRRRPRDRLRPHPRGVDPTGNPAPLNGASCREQVGTYDQVGNGAHPSREDPQPLRLDVQLRSDLLVQHDALGPGADVVHPASLPPLPAQGVRRC